MIILGQKVSLEVVQGLKDSQGEFLDGVYDPYEHVIQRDEKYKDSMQVLLHEAGHGLFHRLGTDLDPNLEDIICDCFAKMITENFDIRLK